jgi:hypothetical protein
MKVQRPFLVCLDVSVKVGEAPEDAATLVGVEGQQLSLVIILMDPKEGGYNGMKCYLIVLHSSHRVVGNTPKVVVVREVEVDINEIRVFCSLVAISQVKVLPKRIQFLRVMEKAVA